MAFDRGDYEEAKRIFTELVKDPESSGVAVYYLAAIAERRGDAGDRAARLSAARRHGAGGCGAQSRGDHALQARAAHRGAAVAAAPATKPRRPHGWRPRVAQAQLLSNSGEGRRRWRASMMRWRVSRPPGSALPEGHRAGEGGSHGRGGHAAGGALSRSTAGRRDQPMRWASCWPITTASWRGPTS